MPPLSRELRPNEFYDHDARMRRALLSLEGLSYGDAFGECFFFLPFAEMQRCVESRQLPVGRWTFTDDTMMAISILETLRMHGGIDEDDLASHFAALYDPMRGYGSAMHRLLLRVRGGHRWQEESASLFEGKGSFGNGSAMRIAPLGAYFADDLQAVVEHARRSAIVTHAHPEGVAGAVAVAAGAALAWQSRESAAPTLTQFLEAIHALVPPSQVRDGIASALQLNADAGVLDAWMALGNGALITAMDTVPLVLWCAGRFIDNYEEAMWQTVSAHGDMDTTCAMVGGIVALRKGLEGIPEEWKRRREALLPMLRSS